MQEMGDAFPAATAFTSVTAEIHEGQGLAVAPGAPETLRTGMGDGERGASGYNATSCAYLFLFGTFCR